jgi:peptidoglycan-associated lipoprotein
LRRQEGNDRSAADRTRHAAARRSHRWKPRIRRPPLRPKSSTRWRSATRTSTFDSYALSSEAKGTLEQNAKELKRVTATNVTIEGHCDERGTKAYNLALGEKRANAAKDYLVALGVSGSRINTVSYGKERPFDDGHDESAWAKNRRAHFVNGQ